MTVHMYNVDVMLVNETHLRASLNPKLLNYRLYRNDRENARGGGIAIYVKADLDHHVLNTPEFLHAKATLVVVQTT